MTHNAVYDRLDSIPEPRLEFTMKCSEGHKVVLTHRAWHIGNRACCSNSACPGEIDLAHARRHVSCPCDDETAPDAFGARFWSGVTSDVGHADNRA